MSPLLNEGCVSILHIGIHTASLVIRGSQFASENHSEYNACTCVYGEHV